MPLQKWQKTKAAKGARGKRVEDIKSRTLLSARRARGRVRQAAGPTGQRRRVQREAGRRRRVAVRIRRVPHRQVLARGVRGAAAGKGGGGDRVGPVALVVGQLDGAVRHLEIYE